MTDRKERKQGNAAVTPERFCVIQYSNTAGYAKRVIKTAFGCVPLAYGRLPKLTDILLPTGLYHSLDSLGVCFWFWLFRGGAF